MKPHILGSLFVLTLLITSAYASKTDAMLKKQCQYIVFGKEENNRFFLGYLHGIVQGISFATPPKDVTAFYKRSKSQTVNLKACENALINVTTHGFVNDFKMETLKLISKRVD